MAKKPANKLYLCRMLTYGITHPTKVGISHDPFSRQKQIWSMAMPAWLCGYFVFSDEEAARVFEAGAIKNFPRYDASLTREIVNADATEVFGFLRESGVRVPFHMARGF